MARMTEIEQVADGDGIVAYVIRSGATAATTSFITPDEASFQAGFVVYPAGGEVVPHVHLPVRREVTGTSELLFVRSGRCHVDVYGADRSLLVTRELGPGDAVLSLGGGHGFRMIEDTVLFELKQGPFIGGAEKVRFERPPDVSEGS
jgi:hypothetical protein